MAAVFTLTFSQNKAYARETPTRVRGDRAAGWDNWRRELPLGWEVTGLVSGRVSAISAGETVRKPGRRHLSGSAVFGVSEHRITLLLIKQAFGLCSDTVMIVPLFSRLR
jgi:hypothetical protein